ncbi:MAG TPA: hypothetical protein VGO67_04395 [Verrucomicrobiae bacterium]|jgi:IS1 family transposase
MVVKMLAEGCGIRAIGRLTGLNKNTVLNILETAGQHCQQLLEDKVKNICAKFVSIDEIFGFVGCLQQNTVKMDSMRGDQYGFLAVDQDSKLIIHWHVGKRTGMDASEFLRGLKPKMVGRFQLTSDQFKGYCAPGASVATVFGGEIDYGFEYKVMAKEPILTPARALRPNPRKVIVCKRIAVSGKPVRDRMTTNISERCNLSVRLFNRRFTRKTLGYSKSLTNHKMAMALQVAYFNFCRTHSAVKIKATETEPAKERTPAMAQGLTDHVWTAEELLNLRVIP